MSERTELPSEILACIVPPDGTKPILRKVPMVTKHCTLPRILYGPTQPGKGPLVPEKLRTTHFLYFGDYHASQEPYHRLPDLQPSQEPDRWSREAWDKRFVCGNDQFHVFCTSERDNDQLGCILKVADHKDHKGDWCYEDFERVKKEDVPDYVTHLKFDIRMQMEKAGIIERSWKNAE